MPWRAVLHRLPPGLQTANSLPGPLIANSRRHRPSAPPPAAARLALGKSWSPIYRNTGRALRFLLGPDRRMAVSLSSDAEGLSAGLRRRERMRWIRYEANGHPVYGIVEGDMVTEVRGDPFAGYEKTATRQPLSSVKLLVPVEPRTFYCAGLNYADHVIEAAKKRGQEPNLPTAADIGYRANNALIAHREPIVIPSDATERLQYEGELVAVIGKKANNLSAITPLSCVLS